jgi:hypothetical protein
MNKILLVLCFVFVFTARAGEVSADCAADIDKLVSLVSKFVEDNNSKNTPGILDAISKFFSLRQKIRSDCDKTDVNVTPHPKPDLDTNCDRIIGRLQTLINENINGDTAAKIKIVNAAFDIIPSYMMSCIRKN